jgi:hypothetical protein
MRKFISILLVIIILGELAAIGFLLYKKFLPQKESSKIEETEPTPEPQSKFESITPTNTPTPTPKADELVEREFTFNSKNYSLLMPSYLERDYNLKNAIGYLKLGQNIDKIYFNAAEVSSNKQLTCSEVKSLDAFSVKIPQFNKNYIICDLLEPAKGGGKTYALNINEKNYLYAILLTGKKEFLESKSGIETAKKIFESFKIK